MAQSSQSTPVVTANLAGEHHQVNLRDYLNARVAPFLKKAITESLDASPEFPLQWLGENLIHQSILYERNPDSTNIRERFLYKFDTPAPAPAQTPTPAPQATPENVATQPPESTSSMGEEPREPAAVTNGEGLATANPVQDAQMSNHVNGEPETAQNEHEEPSRDTEMADTS